MYFVLSINISNKIFIQIILKIKKMNSEKMIEKIDLTGHYDH
jgi:hypothetical protein